MPDVIDTASLPTLPHYTVRRKADGSVIQILFHFKSSFNDHKLEFVELPEDEFTWDGGKIVTHNGDPVPPEIVTYFDEVAEG